MANHAAGCWHVGVFQLISSPSLSTLFFFFPPELSNVVSNPALFSDLAVMQQPTLPDQSKSGAAALALAGRR